LAGDADATAIGAKGHAVIAAFDGVALELAHRQRRQSMRAGVIERDRLSGFAAIDHEIHAEHAMARKFSRDVARRGERIPAVAGSEQGHGASS
jgi:hypothetical protein